VSGQIFISYRREDSSAWAGRLYDHLHDRFPQNEIFMDLDKLPPGIDFVEALEKSVGACDVQVVVIGRRWLTARDKKRRRRLDHPEDFVRLEIGTALRRGIWVILVLVDGASMPRSGELPEDLKSLVRRQALAVSHERFRADAERLIGAVEQALESARVAQQRKREEQERIAVEQREREEKERLEAGRRVPGQNETGAPEGVDSASRALPSGLAITRRLARLLGGEVFVQSRPGEGSRFEVVLPRTACPPEGQARLTVALPDFLLARDALEPGFHPSSATNHKGHPEAPQPQPDLLGARVKPLGRRATGGSPWRPTLTLFDPRRLGPSCLGPQAMRPATGRPRRLPARPTLNGVAFPRPYHRPTPVGRLGSARGRPSTKGTSPGPHGLQPFAKSLSVRLRHCDALAAPQ